MILKSFSSIRSSVITPLLAVAYFRINKINTCLQQYFFKDCKFVSRCFKNRSTLSRGKFPSGIFRWYFNIFINYFCEYFPLNWLYFWSETSVFVLIKFNWYLKYINCFKLQKKSSYTYLSFISMNLMTSLVNCIKNLNLEHTAVKTIG